MSDLERILIERLTAMERRLARLERQESTIGGGDMLKSVYDTNADGRVNLAVDSDTVDGNHAAAFAVAAKGVTNGDSHDHAGGDGAQVDHGGLSGLADDDHTQYLLAAGTRGLSADWDAGSHEIRAQTLEADVATGTAPMTIASTTVVTNLNADLVDGKHANEIGVTNGDSHDHVGGDGAQIDHGGLGGLTDNDHPQYARVASSVTYYVRKAGNDSNDGLSAGAPFLTIQKAIDQFKGRTPSACVIDIGNGNYVENLTIAGIGSTPVNLKIKGDARTTPATTWTHGVTPSTQFDKTNCGSGAITLATDKSGTGGRIRITVTRATTNPDFGADGIDTTNYVYTWDGTTLKEYQVYSVSGNVITLDDSIDSAPSLATAGRCCVIEPGVRIVPSSGVCMQVYSDVWLTGLSIYSSNVALWIDGATVNASYCAILTTVATTALSALYVNAGGAFYNVDPPANYYMPVAIIGKWAGLLVAVDSTVRADRAVAIWSTTNQYSVYVTARCFANLEYSILPIHTGTGVYANQGSYIFAASTNAINYASTKYSPATSDTAGNNNAVITWS